MRSGCAFGSTERTCPARPTSFSLGSEPCCSFMAASGMATRVSATCRIPESRRCIAEPPGHRWLPSPYPRGEASLRRRVHRSGRGALPSRGRCSDRAEARRLEVAASPHRLVIVVDARLAGGVAQSTAGRRPPVVGAPTRAMAKASKPSSLGRVRRGSSIRFAATDRRSFAWQCRDPRVGRSPSGKELRRVETNASATGPSGGADRIRRSASLSTIVKWRTKSANLPPPADSTARQITRPGFFGLLRAKIARRVVDTHRYSAHLQVRSQRFAGLKQVEHQRSRRSWNALPFRNGRLPELPVVRTDIERATMSKPFKRLLPEGEPSCLLPPAGAARREGWRGLAARRAHRSRQRPQRRSPLRVPKGRIAP